MCSCSLVGERVPNAEYSIFTSVSGANVYRADGKVVGQTPLMLKWEDVADVVDGKFVSFLVEKPGYFTRVVFFDATDSVNLKIDLDVDREYKNKRHELALQQLKDLQEQNAILVEQKNYLKESVDQFKKDQNKYIENMEKMSLELKGREEKLHLMQVDQASRVPASVGPVSDVTYNDQRSQTRDADLQILEYKLKECTAQKNNKSNSVKITAKYFPPPKTNAIIRELLTAQFLIISKKFDQAKKIILDLETKNPEVSSLYTLLAYVEMQNGSIDRAKKYVKKSLAIDGKDSMAMRMREMISLIEKKATK